MPGLAIQRRIGLRRGPLDDLDASVEQFHGRGAAFDPIAAVEIVHSMKAPVRGMVDMSTNDAICASPARFGCDLMP